MTGEPLRVVAPALSPGSLVCVLSHGAHGVAPKAEGASTRWCSLFCYRKEDPRVPPPLIGVPPRWVRKAQECAQTPRLLTQEMDDLTVVIAV